MVALLQHYVTARATRRPEATAVVASDATLTYGELEGQSNRLARLLFDTGCTRGDRVAVLAPKSASSIVAIVGIYKADCIYVPLDPSSPAPRLEKMIASAEPRCILAAGPVRPLLDELKVNLPVLWLENGLSDAHSGAPIPSRNHSHDAAHLLFTSGSTGVPKGVVITHANVISFVEWAVSYFGINEKDRHSGHPPLHFDLSMFDIFGTLAAGAALHLVPGDLSLFPNKVADFIRAHQLTQWFSVPSLLTYMANLDVIAMNDFPSLKRVIWCGEALSTPTLMHWMTRLPHASFTNLYGPTETTIASSYYTLTTPPQSPTDPIPIGYACGGESLHVLDADLRPVAAGTTGDLYIGGVGLSPGYWRNEAATNAAFIRSPFDDDARLYRTGDLASRGSGGEFYFHGRADSQIKCRGHRVELGEIETVLSAVAGIRQCAIVAVPSSHFDGHTICCAYIPSSDGLTAAALRGRLASSLPPYMIPSEWMEMRELPKNANGKVDRPLLRSLFEKRSRTAEPRRARTHDHV